MAAHHGDYEPKSLEAVLIAAADALSAARPGARRETLDAYIKRLENLEEIANTTPGVDKSFAIQAGREIRIIAKPEEMSDDDIVLLARRFLKKSNLNWNIGTDQGQCGQRDQSDRLCEIIRRDCCSDAAVPFMIEESKRGREIVIAARDCAGSGNGKGGQMERIGQNVSFYRRLLTLAGPIIVQQLISVGLNLVDNIMVGRLGALELAAVGSANQVFSIYSMILFGLFSGAAVPLAQYYGARDFKSIKKISVWISRSA